MEWWKDIVEFYMISINLNIILLRIGIVVGYCVGASEWLAWWYKVVQYYIGSVSYSLELWMDIVELLLYDYINVFFNICKYFILWCWWLVLWWVVEMEQAGGLHGVIRWYIFILGVFDCAMYVCLIINIDNSIHEWERTLSK